MFRSKHFDIKGFQRPCFAILVVPVQIICNFSIKTSLESIAVILVYVSGSYSSKASHGPVNAFFVGTRLEMVSNGQWSAIFAIRGSLGSSVVVLVGIRGNTFSLIIFLGSVLEMVYEIFVESVA